MIAIIDYGLGNPRSINNMLCHIGFESVITSDVSLIRKAKKLILPGVGAFDEGVRNLRSRKLVPAIESAVLGEGVPILGICLGMQLFSKCSEEGSEKGLGWIDARTIRFRSSEQNACCDGLKIPHMGWNEVDFVQADSPLTRHLKPPSRFYFVHAYHVVCACEKDILGTTHYGTNFTAAVGRGQIFGTQFHPEKSHRYGMEILRGFAEI